MYFGSSKQLNTISQVAQNLVNKLHEKEKQYRGSWIKRGGIGAFMMLARKWDRIEADTEANGMDLMKAIEASAHKPDGLMDDIDDLIGYLILVKAYYRDREIVDNYGQIPIRHHENSFEGPLPQDT